MPLHRFVAVTATNAAKVLALFPRMGAIAPGSDADLVAFDPPVRKTLGAADLHSSDHSVWNGWEVGRRSRCCWARSASAGAGSAGSRATARASAVPRRRAGQALDCRTGLARLS